MASLLLGAFSGFTVFYFGSHPNKYKHKIRALRIKNIEILPCFIIRIRQYKIHIHHWINLPAITLAFYYLSGIQAIDLFNGFVIGGTIQGLTYKDRFKIFTKES